MFKENGREKPADPKETAHALGKTYECFKCGYSEVRNGVAFGEVIRCPKCYKGTLEEQIDV
ncbi:MAG: hypothetical protein PVG39_02395 [Desulfobacteraceae bacterium]